MKELDRQLIADAIEDESFANALLHNDWSDVEDMKFQKLLEQFKKITESICDLLELDTADI